MENSNSSTPLKQTLTQTLSGSHQPTNPLATLLLLLLLLMALVVVANCLLMVSFVAVVGLVTQGLQTSAARATEEWESLVLWFAGGLGCLAVVDSEPIAA